MRAVVIYSARDLRIEEVEVPRPHPGWALVKTEFAGICGTDKAFYIGTYKLFKSPLILGHEVVGRVVEGPENFVGQRVVPEINFSCGRCWYCRSGLYTHCPHKRTLGIDFDGGMAEYFVAPPEALHIFPGPPEKGVFVEPLAAVLRAFSLKPPRPGDRAAIIGSGTLAWLAVQVLRKLFNLDVDVVARRDSVKAEHFKSLANVVYEDSVEENAYDIVFEASGNPEALDTAIKIAKPMGVIHLKSTPGSKACANITTAVVKELAVITSRCGTFREFSLATKLILEGVIEPKISSVFPLDRAVEAFEESLKRHSFRVLLKP